MAVQASRASIAMQQVGVTLTCHYRYTVTGNMPEFASSPFYSSHNRHHQHVPTRVEYCSSYCHPSTPQPPTRTNRSVSCILSRPENRQTSSQWVKAVKAAVMAESSQIQRRLPLRHVHLPLLPNQTRHLLPHRRR